MSVEEDQILRELHSYLQAHPSEETAIMPVYDAALDHSRRRTCTHDQRCPLVMTAAVIVDEWGRVLCLRHGGDYALAEAEPEDQDDSLRDAALRLLAEEAGIRDVWTEPGRESPFLVDVTPAGRHPYGPRLRVGIRYLFRAHSGAVFPSMLETGAVAWVPFDEVGIPALRGRLEGLLIGSR
ncbi:NUDIX domain-containing protein [Streptomyces sp. TBY4]|uniref:NUDIX domain-containing protein n=1 Tax=Streptomyces sp. TBY4 TaxID=2962030 RepID=UPI0020B6824D|nr:NUDIX domain-containing protein [Streptomyces sp. TBY4]MCP3755729.1 NUDIX hydrolase [Streptomyces sp. TBY4]